MKYVTVGVEEVVAETDAAFLFRVYGEEKWVPKSVLEDPGSLAVGDEDVDVEVAEWFAAREEL